MTTLLIGQDVHFTQFTYAPQSYNPSLIGAYSGTYRVSGLYRSQYYNGNEVKGYKTLEVNVDAPIIRGFRDQDWIGVGGSYDQDTRGMFSFKDKISRLGVSYHLGLDKKSRSYVSFGLQYITTGRSLDVDELNTSGLTAAQITNEGLSPTGSTFNDLDLINVIGQGAQNELDLNFSDFVLGISYSAKSKKGNYKFGIAGSQFLKNDISFNSNVDDPLKLVGFFQMFRIINKQLAVEPALMFQAITKSKGFEISGHNMFSYKLKPESDLRIKAGAGFRTGTFSAQALAGASYKGFFGGLAYDIPFTGYQGATQWQSAIEFAIGYIGIIAKKPKAQPIILCPRL